MWELAGSAFVARCCAYTVQRMYAFVTKENWGRGFLDRARSIFRMRSELDDGRMSDDYAS